MAVVLSAYASDSLGQAVRQRAAAEGTTVSPLVLRALERYLRDAPALGGDVGGVTP